MTRSLRILLGTVPLWLAGGAFAQAPAVSLDGATALRDGLTQMLEPILSAKIQGKPLYAGPIAVVPAAAGYTVTFPGVDLPLQVKSRGQDTTLTFHCDPQVYNATSPGGAIWQLESSQTITCTGKTAVDPTVSVTSQTLHARFTADLDQKLFTASDIQAGGVVAGLEGSKAGLKIDSVAMTSGLKPTADPKRQDATFEMKAAGLSATDEEGVERFSLGETVYGGSMDGMDAHAIIGTYGELITVYTGILEQAIASDSAKPAMEPPPEVLQKLMPLMQRIMAAYGDAAQFTVTASDLRVNAPDTQVTVKSLRLVEGFAGASAPKGTGTLEIKMDGLALAPKPPFAQWIPADAVIKLDASDVPWAEFGKAYMGMLEATAGKAPASPEAQAQAQQAMIQMGHILRDAGSKLDITAFRFVAPEAAIDLGGTVQGDKAAVHGVTADLDFRFTNLDGLMKFIQTLPDGQQAVAGLTMVQVLGRQAKADDGRPARDYDIIVDKAGKILINGTDLGALVPKK